MNKNQTERLAMDAKEQTRPVKNGQNIPSHPDYPDELTPEKISVIRRLADPDGKLAEKRVLLYPSLV